MAQAILNFLVGNEKLGKDERIPDNIFIGLDRLKEKIQFCILLRQVC